MWNWFVNVVIYKTFLKKSKWRGLMNSDTQNSRNTQVCVVFLFDIYCSKYFSLFNFSNLKKLQSYNW